MAVGGLSAGRWLLPLDRQLEKTRGPRPGGDKRQTRGLDCAAPCAASTVQAGGTRRRRGPPRLPPLAAPTRRRSAREGRVGGHGRESGGTAGLRSRNRRSGRGPALGETGENRISSGEATGSQRNGCRSRPGPRASTVRCSDRLLGRRSPAKPSPSAGPGMSRRRRQRRRRRVSRRCGRTSWGCRGARAPAARGSRQTRRPARPRGQDGDLVQTVVDGDQRSWIGGARRVHAPPRSFRESHLQSWSSGPTGRSRLGGRVGSSSTPGRRSAPAAQPRRCGMAERGSRQLPALRPLRGRPAPTRASRAEALRRRRGRAAATRFRPRGQYG